MSPEWIPAVAAVITAACGFGKLVLETVQWLTDRHERGLPKHKG
ncbi:hypothetical protein [Bifidobacterium aesculapii]|nr:hypothetical protein [Bifidobacterium aesculapii]